MTPEELERIAAYAATTPPTDQRLFGLLLAEIARLHAGEMELRRQTTLQLCQLFTEKQRVERDRDHWRRTCEQLIEDNAQCTEWLEQLKREVPQ